MFSLLTKEFSWSMEKRRWPVRNVPKNHIETQSPNSRADFIFTVSTERQRPVQEIKACNQHHVKIENKIHWVFLGRSLALARLAALNRLLIFGN